MLARLPYTSVPQFHDFKELYTFLFNRLVGSSQAALK